MTRRQLWISVLIGSALSFVAANRLANQQLVIGSREGGWVTGYAAGYSGRFLEFFLAATALVAIAVAVSWPSLRRLANDGRGGAGAVSAPAGATAGKRLQVDAGRCVVSACGGR